MTVASLDSERKVHPLTAAEAARAGRVAQRLRAELSALLTAFPPPARSPAGMARMFSISRSLCHRLVSALGESADDPRFLAAIPGIEGLRSWAAGARGALPEISDGVFGAADAAIDEFHELIRTTAGSHAKLVARVLAPQGVQRTDPLAGPASRQVEFRKRLYELGAATVGRRIGVRSSVSILRPVEGRADQIEYANVRVFARHTARSGAMPLALFTGITHAESTDGPESTRATTTAFRALDGSTLTGRADTALVREFCTDPLPLIVTRGSADRLSQLVDARLAAGGKLGDVAVAYRIPALGLHPARQSPPILCEGVTVHDPIEQLVFDVYLHRSMAAACVPSLSVFMGQRDVECDPVDRWFDRVEGSPPLTLLGPGLGNAPAASYPRHADLTRHTFNALGWAPNDFVGFRCDEAYPLWCHDYVMVFDYRQPTLAPPGGDCEDMAVS